MGASLSRRDLLRRAKTLALASPLFGLAACDREETRHRAATIAGTTMGTTYSVKITALPDSVDRRALKAGIDRILETVNAQMSNWRSDSEISRFNASASSSWTGVSADTLTVIEEALRVSELSGGAFDPTIGPLVDVWGFGPQEDQWGIPSQNRVVAALGRTGFQHLQTRGLPSGLTKDHAPVEIDLCGIAKGFGVDKVAAYLDAQGLGDYLVEIGGELRARGHSPRQRPWRIGVERPGSERPAVQTIVSLDGSAVATSGNYRNYFESDGFRYSHIIDPRTGAPVEHNLASVTVVAPSTMQADALSTALMVMGPHAGLRLARRADIAALFIVRDGAGFEEVRSPRFEQQALG